MARYPDSFIHRLAQLDPSLSKAEFIPKQYSLWIMVFDRESHRLIPQPSVPFGISIAESRKAFGFRPLWALTFAEKRFNEKRLRTIPTMSSGVFDNASTLSRAYERELLHLDRQPVLCERELDYAGRLQAVTLVGRKAGNIKIQREQRMDKTRFQLEPVKNIGRTHVDLESLLVSPMRIKDKLIPS